MNWKFEAATAYFGAYLVVLSFHVWRSFRTNRKVEPMSFVLLLLFPVVLPIMVSLAVSDRRLRLSQKSEAEAREARQRSECSAFLEIFQAASKCASSSEELLPSEREVCGEGLRELKTGIYRKLTLENVSEELMRLWRAAEAPLEFVHEHFSRILSPEPQELEAERRELSIRYSFRSEPAGWLLGLSKQFVKSIENIDRKLQGRILEALADIARDPMTLKGDTMKPLSHELTGLWRYRLGEFRLIYQPVPAQRQILLVAFASRGEAYS
jgi:mRNA-degrading endonuclease RelE of RelBE toxin-antitoxin system